MTNLPFDEVIDRCIDNISAGRRTVAECVDAYPEHRAELEPLLEAAFAVHALPRIPERTPDPRRRAALMAQIRATPQQSRSRVARPRLGDVLGLSGLRLSMARLATTFVPAAAVAGAAVFAILLVLGRGTSTASASTLTVFAGTVEVESGGTWTAAADGAALAEGTRLRTTADGRAMLTFVDGSTATLEPDTEIVLERVRVNGVRQITIDQRTGRLWNDVVPNGRRGAAYAVRAPDAVAQALGTVFETTVENGTTVTTADGLVQVRAGDRSVRVPAGELVRARAQRIAERLGVTPEAELTVDAPFVASLIARDGQATGARPDGVVFRQLAGVTTTDPARGPQQINLLRAEPGEYTLLLRRFAEGEGAVVIRTATGDVRIPVEAGGRDQQVVLRVRLVDGAPQFEVVNRAELAAQLRAEQERIIESKRTQQAIAVAKARAEAEQARREAEREKRDAEQAERARRKAEARRGKAEAEGRPTAP
ncbi:MAG: hypothetical protein FJZ92_08125, partial [Chloroflexi bacterium]|nr:hypothetical protein [Chloroflexota bacterium]